MTWEPGQPRPADQRVTSDLWPGDQVATFDRRLGVWSRQWVDTARPKSTE